MSIPYTNQGIMVQYVGETRVLSLPRLCLRGRSLDTIASQIRRNGVVTFRSHDDPIFLPYPRYSSPRPFRLPIPLNYAPKLGNREESEAAINEGNAMEFR